MRVLLTGGTGLIGSEVLRAVRERGHHVLAVVRSDRSAERVAAAGADAVVGDITDRRWLSGVLRRVDGAIHTATDNAGPAMDEAVAGAVTDAFSGTGRPYLHTGGIWAWGDNADIVEEAPRNPVDLVAWRVPIEAALLESGVRATVIAPAIVHGPAARIPRMLAGGPRDESGALRLIGTGHQHWATIAASDLGELYALALDRSPGSTVYIGAAGANPTVRELGVAAVGPDGAVVAGTREDAHERFGPLFAEALLLDQRASGAKARAELGWAPTGPQLADVLAGTAAAGHR